MGNRNVLLIVAGAALALLGLTADAIGLGAHPGFGFWQIAALVAGLVIVAIGVFRRRAGGE